MKFGRAFTIHFLSCTLFNLCQRYILYNMQCCWTAQNQTLWRLKQVDLMVYHGLTFFTPLILFTLIYQQLIWNNKGVPVVLSKSHERNYITRKPLRQKPLCLTTWLGGTFRRTGVIQKARSELFYHFSFRKWSTVDVLGLLRSLKPSPFDNVWENQEPKCCQRRSSKRQRFLRRAHLAGLSSTIRWSKQRWVGWHTWRTRRKSDPEMATTSTF